MLVVGVHRSESRSSPFFKFSGNLTAHRNHGGMNTTWWFTPTPQNAWKSRKMCLNIPLNIQYSHDFYLVLGSQTAESLLHRVEAVVVVLILLLYNKNVLFFQKDSFLKKEARSKYTSILLV